MKTNPEITILKILQLNFERGWRGGERQTLYNMTGFRDQGHEVFLLCRKNSPLEQKAIKQGFTTFGFSNVIGAFFFLLGKGRRFDVLHAQSSHILTYAVLSRPFHRAGIIFSRRIFKQPSGWITRWKYRRTDWLTAISPAVKKIMESFTGRTVHLISDVVEERKLDPEHAARLLKDLHIPSASFLIGTTAALTAEKAPLLMIEAVHELWKKRRDFVFLHFGSGALEGRARELIKKLQLEQVYHLMGFVEEVEDIFSVLDLFVMSSQMEGLGTSVLDAFVYRVPVVSTNAGGLGDLLSEGRGLLCERNAPQQLATAIDHMLTHEADREMARTRAYAYVKQFHSLEAITLQYLDMINTPKLP